MPSAPGYARGVKANARVQPRRAQRGKPCDAKRSKAVGWNALLGAIVSTPPRPPHCTPPIRQTRRPVCGSRTATLEHRLANIRLPLPSPR